MTKRIHVSLQDEMFYVGFRIPLSMVDHFDRVAAKQLRTRAEILRSALADALRAQNIIVTGDEDEAAN